MSPPPVHPGRRTAHALTLGRIPQRDSRVGRDTRPALQQGRETVSRQAHNLEFRVRPPALQFSEVRSRGDAAGVIRDESHPTLGSSRPRGPEPDGELVGGCAESDPRGLAPIHGGSSRVRADVTEETAGARARPVAAPRGRPASTEPPPRAGHGAELGRRIEPTAPEPTARDDSRSPGPSRPDGSWSPGDAGGPS